MISNAASGNVAKISLLILAKTCVLSRRDGFQQPYSNFSNRPRPLAQNRGTILMGIAVWPVDEKTQIAIFVGQPPPGVTPSQIGRRCCGGLTPPSQDRPRPLCSVFLRRLPYIHPPTKKVPNLLNCKTHRTPAVFAKLSDLCSNA